MNIILGITGSIGAYKSPFIGRLLLKKGHKVIPVLTKNALHFVTPLTLSSLFNEKVYHDLFDVEENKVPVHVNLARNADLLAVIPATYNFISKITHGIADDLLSLLFHTATCPKIIAPCMHPSLYENEINQKNLRILEERGIYVIEPEYGEMSDLSVGKGRLKEPEEIVGIIENIINLKNKFKDKKILLSFGRTEEKIDPVRVITNRSSGKMGYSLYKALKTLGAEVKAVAGRTDFETGKDIIKVESAIEMLEVLKKEMKRNKYDALIMCAAVSDYRPKQKFEKKIKKERKNLKIEFVRNPDIISELKKFKKKTKFIGFALEDKFNIKEALKKMKEKELDLIILNTLATMGSDKIEMKIIDKKKNIYDFPELLKEKAAFKIIEKIGEIF